MLVLSGAGAVAVLAFAARPAAAQSTVLISNVGQTTDDTLNFNTGRAQRFRTGGNSVGYTVTSIELSTNFSTSSTASDYPTVTLRSGSPTGTVLATFTKPPAGSSSVVEYTLSSSIDLAASTTYWIRTEAISSSSDSWFVAATATTDSGTQTGWSIPGKGQIYNTTAMAWQEYLANVYGQFRINGSAKSANTAPTSSNGTVTTNEDTAYTFAASDFNFSDTDSGDTLSSVKITTLESTGDLELDGADVTLNQVITKADIDADKLKFTPAANGNNSTAIPNTSYATFGFKVNDGTVDSTAAYTMTVSVTAVNDAPTVANPIPDRTATAGASFSYQFPTNTFTDVDSTTLSYTATKSDNSTLPSWLSFNAGARTFSGTPGSGDVGTVSVKVTAYDYDPQGTPPPDGGTVSDTFVITVSGAPNTAGVMVTPTTLTVAEDGTGNYTVVLNSQPSGSVTVTPSSSDSGAASFSPGSLTFTTSNWDTARTVTVTGVEDDNGEDETVTISHSVSGYGSISSAPAVRVTLSDDDGVRVEPTSLSMAEGGSGTYTVALQSRPSGTVTITPSSDNSDVTLSPGSLTFTTSNWDTARTVTVTGVEDDDGEDESVAISHRVSGYGSVSSAPAVRVTISDDDGVRLEPTRLSMAEGGSDIYTVALQSRPSGTVTITPSSDNSDVAFSPDHLTFSSTTWNTPQTITVTALQDDDNEDETVAISHSVSGYRSVSSGDTVTVTVSDDDEATGEAVIQAWLPRFGRSVAQQVVERVSRRLRQRPQAGLEVSVAGEELSNRGPWEEEQGIMAKLLGFETVSEGQLVEGTEFAFSPQQQEHGEGHGEGEGLVFWGGGELSSFNGRQDTISLSGDVTTALVGADWHRQRWSAGAAVAYGWGNGGYEEGGSGGGTLSSSLTGLFPYGRYALNDRLTLQGVVGHSWGRLSLSPEGGEQQSTNIQMSMGALGLDGLLLDGGGEGLTIRSTADALLLGVSSEKTQALAGVQGDVSRLRLGLEAERPFPMPQSDAVLTPSLALAIRQDGGDAETGFGLEAAAALLWTDPLRGMEVELRGRTMVSHGDQSFHEQGFGLSLSWDPNPSSPLGPSLSLSQGMGASPVGGVEALLSRSTMEELSATGDGGGGLEQRLEARWAYGFPSHDNALVITPELGVALSGDGATTTMGFSFSPLPRQNDAWQVVLQGRRHLSSRSRQAPDHSLGLRFSFLL